MEIRNVDALERAADQFSSVIITAYDHNCFPSKIKQARETNWWNRKLEKLRKETRERFIQAKKGNTEELWNLSNATSFKGLTELWGGGGHLDLWTVRH